MACVEIQTETPLGSVIARFSKENILRYGMRAWISQAERLHGKNDTKPSKQGGFSFYAAQVRSAVKRVASDAPVEVLRDAKVWLEGVSKYMLHEGQPFAVLQEVTLYAQAGELVSLIGPSGCGKSTLLNIIAGLEQPSSGTLYLNGHRAEQRLGTVGYMQQKDLLLPWRSVLDNVILG